MAGVPGYPPCAAQRARRVLSSFALALTQKKLMDVVGKEGGRRYGEGKDFWAVLSINSLFG